MKLSNNFILLCLLAVLSCNTITTDKVHQNNDTLNKFNLYPTVKESLDRIVLVANKGFYVLAKSTDSTVRISWGNDTVQRIFSQDIDLPFAERLHQSWGCASPLNDIF